MVQKVEYMVRSTSSRRFSTDFLFLAISSKERDELIDLIERLERCLPDREARDWNKGDISSTICIYYYSPINIIITFFILHNNRIYWTKI